MNADVRADRPVTATGEPLEIRSKQSLFIIAATSSFRLLYLFDDNMLVDNLDREKAGSVAKPLSFVLNNALFKTTAVNGCLLFGTLAEDFVKVERASLFLTLGLHAYLPTLPDPYAANVEPAQVPVSRSDRPRAFRRESADRLAAACLPGAVGARRGSGGQSRSLVPFRTAPEPTRVDADRRGRLDFVFLAGGGSSAGVDAQCRHAAGCILFNAAKERPIMARSGRKRRSRLQPDQFALLDVSTNADLLGVSFGVFGSQRVAMLTTMLPAGSGFPLQVKGMEVVTAG